MEKFLGQCLVEKKLITAEELDMALERQKLQGGRIGQNLVALNLITQEALETFFTVTPAAPRSLEDTGLQLSFIADLVLKQVHFLGEFTLSEVGEKVKLPLSVVEKAVDTLRKEHFLEVRGAAQLTELSYRYGLTERGRHQAEELFSLCRYVGPAPVTLNEYRQMVRAQTVKNIIVSGESLKKAFSQLIISNQLLRRLGPAVSSGKTIFLYGPPGNGKTAIAETLGKVLPGAIYIPYSLLVGGEIITLYDPVNHVAVTGEGDADCADQRWILIKRPVIMTGGELTLKTLDLDFNLISKFYEAPLQMKANNGLFILDDFGRQQIDPKMLLNRWIVPLERKIDFFTLHTGMKFDVPFDQLVIFSTNIEPRTLVDEAFLRRIRYKIKIDHPASPEYEQIFRGVCESNNIGFKKEVFDYLIESYYKKCDVKLNACHPRDIVDHIIDDAHHHGYSPELTRETISAAWENYFVPM